MPTTRESLIEYDPAIQGSPFLPRLLRALEAFPLFLELDPILTYGTIINILRAPDIESRTPLVWVPVAMLKEISALELELSRMQLQALDRTAVATTTEIEARVLAKMRTEDTEDPVLLEFPPRESTGRVCRCGLPESVEAWDKGDRGCPACKAVWPENLRPFAQRTDPGTHDQGPPEE